MPCQLPTECLDEIFDHLRYDDETLHSCLLVNRRWCEVSVRFLWEKIWNYDTLILCLPDRSKQILRENNIPIPTLTSKPPLFNYSSFVKSISVDDLDRQIKRILTTHQPNISNDVFDEKFILIMCLIFTM
jgi:hypothetical protein